MVDAPAQKKRQRPFKPPSRASSSAGPSASAPKPKPKPKQTNSKAATNKATSLATASNSNSHKAPTPAKRKRDDPPPSASESADGSDADSDASAHSRERSLSQEPDFILAEIITHHEKNEDVNSSDPQIPSKLLTRLLHHHFQNEKTKIAKDANTVVAKYGKHSLDVIEYSVQNGEDDKDVSQSLVGRNGIPSRHNGPCVEYQECADGGDQVDRTTTKSVDEESEGEVGYKSLRLDTRVDSELSRRLGDTDAVHDLLEIVGDQTVSTPLTEQTQCSDQPNTLAVALGLQEVHPAGLVNLFVQVDGCLDLRKLEMHKLIVLVTLAVVLDQHPHGVLVSSLAHEPTGTLGHDPDTAHNHNGTNSLQETGEAPGPVALAEGRENVLVQQQNRITP